ncbi:MAG: hypothetical protein K0S55_1635, partial [Clostridia bacterium]|nr:hypothetical protein [Clostridia bacterium]
IPYISYILAISSCLVSIPTYFFPVLYDIYGGEKPIYYPWQDFTHYLQHGTICGQVPLPAHLIWNLLVIMIYGVISEKILGTKKFFILSFTAMLVSQIMRQTLDFKGNGASGIIWAYAPIVFVCIYHLFFKYKKKLLKDYMFYVCNFILFAMWFLITVINIFIENSNLFHLTATVTGAVFAFIWRDNITEGINRLLFTENYNFKHDKWYKVIIFINILVPTFVIVIFLLTSSGLLTNHTSTSKIIDIYPESGVIEPINNNDNNIVIKFSEPMEKVIIHSSINTYSEEGLPQLSAELIWESEEILHIKLSRNIHTGEKLKILLKGFYDKKNKKLHEELRLEYGY